MDEKANEKDLREQLEELHGHIENAELAENVDEKTQALLRDVKADIDGMLARPEDAPLHPEPQALSRLEEAIETFEASHPTLTKMLSQVLDTLSGAGI